VPDTVLMLVPNHSNNGEALALWTEGPWLVPGHALEADLELTEALQAALPGLIPDRVAFENHPAEMQLPFIQYLNPEAKVAVIAVRDTPSTHFPEFDVARIEAFGAAISEVLATRDDVLLLSSSDLTHYASVETAEAEDTQLISHINSLDVEGLHSYVTTD
jgi:AmmeMemoRadiSam system protein B